MSVLSAFAASLREDLWRPSFYNYRRKKISKRSSKTDKIKAVTVNEDKVPIYDAKSSTDIIVSESSTKTEEDLDLTEERLTHSALRVVEKGTYAIHDSCPIPVFHNDEEVMIKNYATGLNPIDWKSVDYNFCLPSFPWVTGREMAGVVHKVAPGVTSFKPGDRVWTSTYYRDVRAGCFQELVVVPQHTVLPIPNDLDFESAACLGVPALTASMTLWKWLKVPMIDESTSSSTLTTANDRECLLVWGGSTVTGQFAVQIAAQSGLEVIAVTSSKTQLLVKSLGAHSVIVRDDKTKDEIVEEIIAIGGDRITRALDLVGNSTAPFSLKTLSKTKPCLFAPLALMDPQEVAENIEVLNVEMKQFVNDKSSIIYAEQLNHLLTAKKIRLPELEVLKGGLPSVIHGLERLKKGDMGGKKLVVSFTP